LKTYGAASAPKHDLLRSLGATPIDYRTGPLDRLTRALEPEGVDCVFDAVGGSNIGPYIGARLRGRRGAFYGITALYRKDPQSLREDLPKIFALLSEKKIDPLVNRTFALLEAKQAIEFLATGSVEGKIVLMNS
jgi:NADPH:quinone reductase-like Zn-dependent oxidoreductase